MSTVTFPQPPTDADEPDRDPAGSRLRRRLAVARHELAGVGDRAVRDGHGSADTVRGVTTRLAHLHRVIHEDPTPARHRRISRGQRVLRGLLPLLDGVVFWWFLIGVLNIDLAHPQPTLGVSIALAVLGTVALAAWAGIVGEHLARFVDARRRLAWAAVDVVGRAMLLATAVVWGLLAAMMWVRVRDEVFQATGVVDVGGAIVASALAAAVVVVNAYVLYLSWSDGSDETREAEVLARALAPHLRARQRLARRVTELTERVAAKEAATRATDRGR